MPDLTVKLRLTIILTALTTLTMLTAGLVGVVRLVKEGETFSYTVVFEIGRE